MKELSKKELLKYLEDNREYLEERYFQNWSAYTYGMSIYMSIDKFSGEIKATDKNNWNYERCIRIKKIGTYKTDMAKTKQDMLDKTKEEQFKELYIENDKLYKMAKRAINRYFKKKEKEKEYYELQLKKQIEEEIENMTIDDQLDLVF